MCRLIETIKVQDGTIHNLALHQQRMDRSRRRLFGPLPPIDLEGLQYSAPPEGLYKCRIVYNQSLHWVEFLPYHRREIRSLRLVEDDSIDYALKYEDRRHLQRLQQQSGACDDIIIVKNGCITDSTYANLLFESEGRLYTPDTPLLPGIRREQLLREGRISERRITPGDVPHFERVHLINAMLEVGECAVESELVVGSE